MEYKNCSSCKLDKLLSDFYIRNDKKTIRHHGQCKECIKSKNRNYQRDPVYIEKRRTRYIKNRTNPEYVQDNKRRGREFYNSIEGRAKTLFSAAKRRSASFSCDFDIDVKFIEDRLRAGLCEVTGIEFQYGSYDRCVKNPFSPSIDRIDNSKGYTKLNVRFVIWQVNLMHGELTDPIMLQICEKIIQGLK